MKLEDYHKFSQSNKTDRYWNYFEIFHYPSKVKELMLQLRKHQLFNHKEDQERFKVVDTIL